MAQPLGCLQPPKAMGHHWHKEDQANEAAVRVLLHSAVLMGPEEEWGCEHPKATAPTSPSVRCKVQSWGEGVSTVEILQITGDSYFLKRVNETNMAWGKKKKRE